MTEPSTYLPMNGHIMQPSVFCNPLKILKCFHNKTYGHINQHQLYHPDQACNSFISNQRLKSLKRDMKGPICFFPKKDTSSGPKIPEKLTDPFWNSEIHWVGAIPLYIEEHLTPFFKFQSISYLASTSLSSKYIFYGKSVFDSQAWFFEQKYAVCTHVAIHSGSDEEKCCLDFLLQPVSSQKLWG